jgi:hypothetical protein
VLPNAVIDRLRTAELYAVHKTLRTGSQAQNASLNLINFISSQTALCVCVCISGCLPLEAAAP